MSMEVTYQLGSLLHDTTASARSIVGFVVGPTCGLESRHQYALTFINTTPFLMAVAANRLDVAQLLVAEHSVDTEAVTDRNYTVLHVASQFSCIELVRWLVEQCGLDVHAVDADDQTPLHWAIITGSSDVALLLLELGADPTTPDTSQYTPLHYACQNGLVDVARVLLAKGASRDAVNWMGKTPLDLALFNEHGEVAALLGARP